MLPRTKEPWIAAIAIVAIALHLTLAFATTATTFWTNLPLWSALGLGGVPLVAELVVKLFRAEFGSDLLAGLSIVVSLILGEYLAGTLVVLMLSGGQTLEGYAVRQASSVLAALARRMPTMAHRRRDGTFQDVPLQDIEVGHELIVLPHEICPADGTVLEGHGVMDESYLTGEPYRMSKAPGATVLSGAINGDSALTIRADKLPSDSRYAKIMQVMQASEQQRPKLRRMADQLGAAYTPLAISVALLAWLLSGDSLRFLAVLVVATPCPLLIAIPVALIGSISLAAKRAIIIRNPSVLEVVDSCSVMIFDKTGTLTYGEPTLQHRHTADGFQDLEVLGLVASLEAYSKHPLAQATRRAAEEAKTLRHDVSQVSEQPGQGLRGSVAQHSVRVTSRQKLLEEQPDLKPALPPTAGGLECVILVDNQFAALYQFRDQPREDSLAFIRHLATRHPIKRVLLVSGDRVSEAEYLAGQVGIREVFASQSPEDKLEIVRRETNQTGTIFVGDGINDAPALTSATVGIAFGPNSDVTTQAADVVVMDSSLAKVDEFLHISQRLRRIAMQSAVGGMMLSIVAMMVAATGHLPPVAGAIVQEVIDVISVLNALRVAWVPATLRDFD